MKREQNSLSLRRVLAAALCLIGWTIGFLALLIATPLAYYFGNPLKDPSLPQPGDVIVLLSHGQINDVWLSPEGAQRTWAALRLYKAGYAPAIISSGSSVKQGLDQAGLQAKWLMEAGVPSQAILVERHSSRTYESAVETVNIFKAKGWHRAVIVTSELDVPRVRAVFKKLGVDDLSFEQVAEFAPPSGSLYYASGWRAFYHATYEYAGLLLYKWKGWI
jgi:uncharacterized SAM-binding protein YcdF (DUF218 family)